MLNPNERNLKSLQMISGKFIAFFFSFCCCVPCVIVFVCLCVRVEMKKIGETKRIIN